MLSPVKPTKLERRGNPALSCSASWAVIPSILLGELVFYNLHTVSTTCSTTCATLRASMYAPPFLNWYPDLRCSLTYSSISIWRITSAEIELPTLASSSSGTGESTVRTLRADPPASRRAICIPAILMPASPKCLP